MDVGQRASRVLGYGLALASVIHPSAKLPHATLPARRFSARRAAGNTHVYASFRPHGEDVPALYYSFYIC